MNLKNKKIGIWGFGVVGKSVFNYVNKFTNYVQILDQNTHPEITIILQSPKTIQKFLDENDYIIISPGILLHEYEAYRHKFICELDLFAPNYDGTTIAITGTAGKTTVTDFIAQSIPNSVAAGNIGFAMLDVLKLDPKPATVVLELSSYQLQYSNKFAPDIAIWTNFFANHLDHHKDIAEYFAAKCNILKHQTKDQKAIVHHDLIYEILKNIDYQGKLFTYSGNKPNDFKNTSGTFYVENNGLFLWQNGETITIFNNFNNLPSTTFQENWITILATLYLTGQDLSSLNFTDCTPQPHRVEYVGMYKNIAIYNDSKSTICESTKQALSLFLDKKVALIIGGLSKGANREPLIEYIAQQKNITLFIFGEDKNLLASFCNKYQISYFTTKTLQEILEIFKKHHTEFEVLLFSPAGSSFDQFKNYQDRGNQFIKLIKLLDKY
jgi:UDP-N-acetylmuramoylalanine--D-glutamate ligase